MKSLEWIRADEAKRAAQRQRGRQTKLDPQTPEAWAEVWRDERGAR